MVQTAATFRLRGWLREFLRRMIVGKNWQGRIGQAWQRLPDAAGILFPGNHSHPTGRRPCKSGAAPTPSLAGGR